jgi:hypothetical protein
MTEQELRDLVREAVARRALRSGLEPARARAVDVLFERQHASHVLLPLPSGDDGDGACLIEPTVPCNHCGYCVSYGH